MKSANKPWNPLPKPVVVAVLGGAGGKRHVPASLVECGGRTLKLQMESCLSHQTAIKIEVDGGLVLGSVASAQPHNSSWMLTIDIDQVIPDAAGLARLVSAVLGQQPPAASPYNPQEKRAEVEEAKPQPSLRPSPR